MFYQFCTILPTTTFYLPKEGQPTYYSFQFAPFVPDWFLFTPTVLPVLTIAYHYRTPLPDRSTYSSPAHSTPPPFLSTAFLRCLTATPLLCARQLWLKPAAAAFLILVRSRGTLPCVRSRIPHHTYYSVLGLRFVPTVPFACHRSGLVTTWVPRSFQFVLPATGKRRIPLHARLPRVRLPAVRCVCLFSSPPYHHLRAGLLPPLLPPPRFFVLRAIAVLSLTLTYRTFTAHCYLPPPPLFVPHLPATTGCGITCAQFFRHWFLPDWPCCFALYWLLRGGTCRRLFASVPRCTAPFVGSLPAYAFQRTVLATTHTVRLPLPRLPRVPPLPTCGFRLRFAI